MTSRTQQFKNVVTAIGSNTKAKSEKWMNEKKKELSTREYWKGKITIINWISEYNTSYFVSDLIAGVTIGLIVIPLSMASAVVGGLPPQFGLYSSFIPCFVYLFLGTSRDITIGPTTIAAILIKPHADRFGPELIILITFATGIFITLLGLFQLGFIVDFISMPVLVGFISAASISIASSQLAALLGFKNSGTTCFHYWKNLVNRIGDTKLWDPIFGGICILALLGLQFAPKYIKPSGNSCCARFITGFVRYLCLGRNVIVVLIATGAVAGIIKETGQSYVAITGPVKEGFPEVKVPRLDFVHNNRTLTFQEGVAEVSSAFIIPFILILESIATAKTFAGETKIDATQEMLAVGISNIIGSFFQAIPVTGSFPRSTVNHAAGVKTPLGGIYTGIIVILCLFFLTEYLQYLPKPGLAAIIICAVIFMIEIHHVAVTLWKTKRMDLIPLFTTFFGCIFLGMDMGFIIGIVINMLFILHEASRPKLRHGMQTISGKKVLLLRPDRSILYPAAEYLKDEINDACREEIHEDGILIVIDGRKIHAIDSTAVKVLKATLKTLRKNKHCIIFWNWNEKNKNSFVNYDNKNRILFREAETLELLVMNALQDLEKIRNSDLEKPLGIVQAMKGLVVGLIDRINNMISALSGNQELNKTSADILIHNIEHGHEDDHEHGHEEDHHN